MSRSKGRDGLREGFGIHRCAGRANGGGKTGGRHAIRLICMGSVDVSAEDWAFSGVVDGS